MNTTKKQTQRERLAALEAEIAEQRAINMKSLELFRVIITRLNGRRPTAALFEGVKR